MCVFRWFFTHALTEPRNTYSVFSLCSCSGQSMVGPSTEKLCWGAEAWLEYSRALMRDDTGGYLDLEPPAACDLELLHCAQVWGHIGA